MKILKKSKGLLRLYTANGTIILQEGNNEVSNKQLQYIQSHPLYEATVEASGLFLVKEEVVQIAEGEIEEGGSIDLIGTNLDRLNKSQLIKIANSLDINIEGLKKENIIESIRSAQ